MSSTPLKTRIRHWIRRDGPVLLVYSVLAVVMTYPLIWHLATKDLPYYTGDLAMKLWDLYWFDKILLHGKSLFYTDYLFYPHGLNLSYHPASWTTTAVMWPFTKIADTATVFKVQYFSALILPAYAMYLLVIYLLKNRLAAIFGGLVYSFAPYHFHHIWEHPDIAQIAALPLAILLLFIGFKQRHRFTSWLSMTGAGLMVGLLAWTGLYLFGFAIATLGPVLFYLLLSSKRKKTGQIWMGVALFVLVTTVTAGPRLYPIFSTPDTLAHVIDKKYDAQPWLVQNFLGFVLPFQHPWFGDFLGNVFNVVTEYAYLGIIPLALSGLALTRVRPRNQMRLWALIALIFFLMSLGPELSFNETMLGIPLPAALLHNQVSLARAVDGHFYVLGLLLPLAILAAQGLNWLQTHLTHQSHQWVLGSGACLLMLVGYYLGPYKGDTGYLANDFYQQLGEDPGEYAIFQLPIGYNTGKDQLYQQTVHDKPIGAGMTSRMPQDAYDYINGNYLLEHWTNNQGCSDVEFAAARESVSALLADGFRYITVRRRSLNDKILSCFAVDPVYQEGNFIAYFLPDFPGHENVRGLLPLWPPDAANATSQIADENGRTPCGVFDVGGFGYRELFFAYYPACTDTGQIDGPVAVQCLNSEGGWVDETTIEEQVNADRKSMSFVSQQGGTCGIFLTDGNTP